MSFKTKHLKNQIGPYFIAEIGINHNGIVELAKKMIEESKNAGADAVKFQKREIRNLVDPNTVIETPTGYLSKSENDIPDENKAFGTWTYPDSRLEFDDKTYRDLMAFSKNLDLDFIVSPWEEKSVDFLVENEAKVIKVASIDAINYQFIEYISSKNIPTIVSTGMCSYDQLIVTHDIFKKNNCPMIFLHCTSAYPCPIEDKNLSVMNVMKSLFGEDIGFSGHGTGIEGTMAAVALGASVVEKHVTLSRKMSGPDQNASLEFSEFKRLVELSNNVVKSMGSSHKKLKDSELTLKSILEKKFITTKKLNMGETIDENSIRTVVTSNKNGISPENFYKIQSYRAKSIIEKDTVLSFDDLELIHED